MPRRLLLVAVMAAALLGAGCAGLQRRPPPTLEEIVQMSKEGMPAEQIIQRLRESRAVYRVSGSQLARLHDEGVPEAVLDYIQQAYIDDVRWRERMYYHDHLWMYGCIGCYYRPWPPPYFIIPY